MAGAELPRRVAWRRQGAPTDPREHIIDAASRCLASLGLERTSLTSIAQAAGVSRQTIYKYFATKEEIVAKALETEAARASERIMTAAKSNTTAADYAVELFMAARAEFLRNPAISPMMTVLGQVEQSRRVLAPESIAIARHFLEPILAYAPEMEPHLDEMTETFTRIHLSFLEFASDITESEGALRDYLHRVLVPALGLTAAR